MKIARIIRNLTINFLLFILVITIFFGIGEIYARKKYEKWYLTGLMTRHPVFHHVPPAYYKGKMQSEGDFNFFITTNNKGMRGPGDYVYEKPNDVFRIAVIGDSFTFGVGVEEYETMCYVLQKKLNREKESNYQVYNFGVNSYSPLLEYVYLKNELVKYKPDLIIVMFDISDVQDDYLYEPHVILDKNGDVIGCDPLRVNGKPDIKTYLMKDSRFYSMLDRKLIQSFKKMKTLGYGNYFSNKFKGVRNKTEILKNKDIDNINFDKFIMFREGKNKNIVLRHWNRTAKYLKLIKEYCDKNSLNLIVVVYPYGHQIGENQWTIGRSYWAFDQNKVYDPKEGFDIIENFADRNKIDFINLYGVFSENAGKMLYFERDGHWTKEGQQLAAEEVFYSPIFERYLPK